MANVLERSAPPYAENGPTNDLLPPQNPQSHDNQELSPPPYEPSSNPSATARASDKKTEEPTISQSSTAEAAGSSSSRSSFSFRKLASAYEEKKRAKKAAELVDFYENEYGFVPKNVMTETEWKRARENAPKEKVTRFKTNLYQGHWD